MPSVNFCPNLKYTPKDSPAPEQNGILCCGSDSPYIRAFTMTSEADNTLVQLGNPSVNPGSTTQGCDMHPNKKWVACVTDNALMVYEFDYKNGFGNRVSNIAHTSASLDCCRFSGDGKTLFISGSNLGSKVLAYAFDEETGLGSAFTSPAISTATVVDMFVARDGGYVAFCGAGGSQYEVWRFTPAGWGTKLSVQAVSAATTQLGDYSREVNGFRWMGWGNSVGYQLSVTNNEVGQAWFQTNFNGKVVDAIAFWPKDQYVKHACLTDRNNTPTLYVWELTESFPYRTAVAQIAVGGTIVNRITWTNYGIWVCHDTAPRLRKFLYNQSSKSLTPVTIVGGSFNGFVGDVVQW